MVKMSKEEVKAILGKVLLAFQICLGLWQFFKLTPLGALLQGVVGCLLRPLGLSPSYTRLQCLPGRLFKRVEYFLVFEDRLKSPDRRERDDENIELQYLGMDFHLQRKNNMLFVNEKMCYYITPKLWNELAFTASVLADLSAKAKVPNAVFLENYKEIWEHVATGRDMTFEKVLDHIILDSHTSRLIEGSSMLLPVDLSVSEEKVVKMLNLAGFFLQTNSSVYWLIPPLLSLTSTVLEFTTPLRIRIYEKINLLFCFAMHVICDRLPRSMRSQIYGLGKLVDNLKPTNDIKLKVTKGNITATIAGGAKVHTEGALTLVPLYALEEADTETFRYDNIEIKCTFDADNQVCLIRATTFDDISVECRTRSRFLSILTLVWSIAENGSGSLKSYGPHRKVCVRGLKETVYSYISNACPPVYEMELENVVVN